MTRLRWLTAIAAVAGILIAACIVYPLAQLERDVTSPARVDAVDPTKSAPVGAMMDAARWIDASALTNAGFGDVRFVARDGNELTAEIYRGSGFDPLTGPIWFVMHGASRAAERYVSTAAPIAERHNALAITIYFPRTLYPRGSDYTLGVTTSGSLDGTALAEGRWRVPSGYLYAEVERVFEAVRESLGGQQTGYYLFGHSAGAQFAHRLMTFVPNARVIRAVAANAGWYTLPLAEPVRSRTVPYGLNESPVAPWELNRLLSASLVVLLGERDTRTPTADRLVRGTAEAMAQGRSRLERGRYYFAAGQAQARALNAPFGWRLAIAPRAGHDAAQVIDSAAYFLFGPDEPPCMTTPAADANGIVITEILADPPSESLGDANGDGRRDPSEDEFVEIVNTGPAPVCLTGWALGDARSSERHVFPIDRALEPGEPLIVFGGGVPTGQFGGAHVQQAAFDGRLSLSNEGDVITLRDARSAIVIQVSWGDCEQESCAADHWIGALDVEGSIFRSPEPAGTWNLHAELTSARFSPGLRGDGSVW